MAPQGQLPRSLLPASTLRHSLPLLQEALEQRSRVSVSCFPIHSEELSQDFFSLDRIKSSWLFVPFLNVFQYLNYAESHWCEKRRKKPYQLIRILKHSLIFFCDMHIHLAGRMLLRMLTLCAVLIFDHVQKLWIKTCGFLHLLKFLDAGEEEPALLHWHQHLLVKVWLKCCLWE